MSEIKSTGVPVVHADPGVIVRRLHRYPGCDGFAVRWFIVGDRVQKAYISHIEAVAELQRRQGDRRQA